MVDQIEKDAVCVAGKEMEARGDEGFNRNHTAVSATYSTHARAFSGADAEADASPSPSNAIAVAPTNTCAHADASVRGHQR